MCRACRALVPARVVEENGAVFQERLCPKCGTSRARIADGLEWYLDRTATPVRCQPPRLPGGEVRLGCPHDCGLCAFHANACHLPVFSVTNACNMDCPICFTYNRPDEKYFMSREELRAVFDDYFAFVYYQYYRERGMALDTAFDPRLLAQIGLPPQASADDIKRRFRELAKKYHPDAGGDSAHFIELMDVYSRLK